MIFLLILMLGSMGFLCWYEYSADQREKVAQIKHMVKVSQKRERWPDSKRSARWGCYR